MMLPSLVLTFIFFYLPLSGWVIAFSEYKLGGPLFGNAWVGLKQFKRFLFDSSDFSYLLQNTLVINVSVIFVNIAVAGVFSIVLNDMRRKRMAKTVQTIAFFPYFISWVIAYALVWALFAVRSGSINQFLVGAGAIPSGFNILGDPKYSWGLMIVLSIWKYTGYNTVIFLSAISGIPHEEYEAAAIDGAGRFRRMYYVTFKNMLPSAAILLIMNSGWVLNSNLEQFFVFTNSTNWQRMEVLDMYIYKFGLQSLDYSYATAVGIMKTLVSILLVIGVNFSSKKLNGSAIF